MAPFNSHSLTLLRQVFSPLLLLMIFVFIIHPSYGEEPILRGRNLVNELCNRTSDHVFCVNTIYPDPPSFARDGETAIGFTKIALDIALTRADEAGSIIASLLNNSSSSSVVDPEVRQLLQGCWTLNNIAILDLWFAKNLFKINKIDVDAIVENLNYAAHTTKYCKDMIQGTSFPDLAAKNIDLIKLCEICVVSIKYFTTEGAP